VGSADSRQVAGDGGLANATFLVENNVLHNEFL
jgi:hypothetical protein